MTAEELREKVAIDLFGDRHQWEVLLQTDQNYWRNEAGGAIKVCMEAAIIVPSNRANEANMIGDQKTMSQMHIIMDELYKLIPESAK